MKVFILSVINFLSPVNCSDPTSPMEGSIDAYQNTTEGAEILFMCNPGFIPAGRMRAVCGADGRWNPDPADHRCTCEYPSLVYSYHHHTVVHILCSYVPTGI